MKTLYYFRHSTQDGVGNTIGPKGLELAEKVGSWFEDEQDEMNFQKVFHGPLVRTAQTALAFLSGSCYTPVVMPVVQEIGDEELFKAMKAPSEFETLAPEMGNFHALIVCHDSLHVGSWMAIAEIAVKQMFEALADGEVGLAFGHSPMIELTLAVILDTMGLPQEYAGFGDMEGVELRLEGGVIKPVRKISMPVD